MGVQPTQEDENGADERLSGWPGLVFETWVSPANGFGPEPSFSPFSSRPERQSSRNSDP